MSLDLIISKYSPLYSKKAADTFFELPIQKPLSLAKMAHGTHFAVLPLMERTGGLVPNGELIRKKYPVFSGENFRGCSEGGVNQKNTSWAPIGDAELAIDYSRHFVFDPKELKTYFREILEDNAIVKSGRETKGGRSYNVFSQNYPPLAQDTYSGHWHQALLKIRQLRAWDPDLFEKEFHKPLCGWMQDVISYATAYHEKTKGMMATKEEIAESISSMKTIQKELNEPFEFKLTEAEKAAIQKQYPIVFISARDDLISFIGNGEYGVDRPMKLGRDIQWIATTPEAKKEVVLWLKQRGLASKVRVISFEILLKRSQPTQSKL